MNILQRTLFIRKCLFSEGSNGRSHKMLCSAIASRKCCHPYEFGQHRHCSTRKPKRPDPFARRPTEKCDPYGQGGKPLPLWEAKALLATIDPQWKMEERSSNEHGDTSSPPPQALSREFVHVDFITGSKFVAKMAAVAQLNIHYPSITLERRIVPHKKEWQVVTRIQCHTVVLGGLSTHDFHLAMLIDVEAERPEVKELQMSNEENAESKK